MDPFLETILMSSAFRAATGQGKDTQIYRSKRDSETQPDYDSAKKLFRQDFKKQVILLCREYDGSCLTEEQWLALLQNLQTSLDIAHGNILDNNRLRLGIVQKMVSLGLKFYWRSGDEDKKPFWPPLDRQVIIAAREGLASQDKSVSWKKLDDRTQYVRIMQAIDQFARAEGFADACEWEYQVWKTNDEKAGTG